MVKISNKKRDWMLSLVIGSLMMVVGTLLAFSPLSKGTSVLTVATILGAGGLGMLFFALFTYLEARKKARTH
jgi:hypothetical protein